MKKLQGSKRKETKKSPGSKRKTMTTQMPSAFELAVLAAGFTGGNLHKAFHSYLSASYYLKTNGLAELALWEGALSEEKVEAFVKLTSGGALVRGQAVIEYKKLVSGLKPGLKLYKDKRDDAVKYAIRAVTARTCNYQTARNHLKKAWLLKRSRYTSAELKISTNGSRADIFPLPLRVEALDEECRRMASRRFSSDPICRRMLIASSSDLSDISIRSG